MKTDLYNIRNESVGSIELPDEVFGIKWNPALVKQVVLAQLANKRRPWAHAKNRSEVRGGGRKPWRQKGTGRARHGSIRSPLWVGGGKSHGPQKERDYSEKVNKKMRRLAMFSILSKKFKDKEVKVFDNFSIHAPKTKILASTLRLFIEPKKTKERFDVLLISNPEDKNLSRAGANLQKTKVLTPTTLNPYDLMKYKNIFIDEKAILVIAKHYAIKK